MSSSAKAFSFVADSAPEAVAQIRRQLGPDAMVVNVRKLPVEGLARLWQKPRIEVIACLPTEAEPEPEGQGTSPLLAQLELLRREMGDMRRRIDDSQRAPADPVPTRTDTASFASVPSVAPADAPARLPGGATLSQHLQTLGLNVLSAALVEDRVFAADERLASRSLAEQMAVADRVLESLWRPAPETGRGLHVMIGPAGSGKTTALCKWLTQVSLMEGRLTSLWRLDGVTANQAEHLSVHGEILGVPVERVWPGALAMGDIGFIDLPGVDWKDRAALGELGRLLDKFGDATVHLVLNAAYESDTLLAQTRAFSVLPVRDIIVTHLDEESRPSKLWNLVLGTNLPISFLGAGQNLPGIFERATGRKLLARPSPRPTAAKALFSVCSSH